MTIEDPVEYLFPTINQIQINEQAGITFADGLRSILRQDPDAILVGEIRDVETARIAVQAALTGHFVMSSLHATDATSALCTGSWTWGSSRSSSCPRCSASSASGSCAGSAPTAGPYEPTVDELAFYEEIGGTEKQRSSGRGLQLLPNTGYFERVGVYEVLRMTEGMRQLVVENPQHTAMRDLAIDEGMRPLAHSAPRS